MSFIHDAFENNWVAPVGDNVGGFERDLSNYTGVEHATAVTSGTAAIHLGLIVLDVKPGDVAKDQLKEVRALQRVLGD